MNFTKDFHEPIIGECDHDIHFTIQAYAFPDISFINLFWYKDGNPLLINTNDSLIQMNLMNFSDENQTQITLYIISARPSDSGVYTLVGQTSWSSSQQQQQQNESITNKISIPVYIEGDIEILIENHQNFYQLNHTYELICKSYGYPHPSIQWQWHPCETVHSCLNDDDHNDDNQIKWYNITISSSMLNQDNDAKIIQINNETIVPYLNKSRLALKARQSGVYRCLSTLINMNNDNNHTIVKHQEIPFIVMDDEDLFKITSSTNEPTVNDTIILTCKASVYRYSQLWWVNTRLDTDVINPVNVNTMLEQKNQSNDPLIESISLSNDQNEYSLSSTLILTSVTLNHSSLFTCEAVLLFDALKIERKEFFLDVKEITSPIIIETNMNESIIEEEYNSQTELRCYIEGRPRPKIEWYRNDQPLQFDHHDSGVRIYDKGQRIVFTRLLAKDSGLYVCRGRNRGGEVTCAVLLKVIGNMDHTSIDLLPIIVYSIMGAITIIMACLIGKRIRDEKLQRRELEFFSKTLFEQGQMQLFNPDMPLDEQIDLLPYDSRFEFPKERLILGRTLGQGAFGRVVKAQAIGLDESDESESTTVAVKMLKERADSNQRKALMAELKILIHLGRHLNIVNLLGAVTKNLVKGELLVIVEYCQFGNLRHYLIANRDNFINQLNPLNGKIDRSIIRNGVGIQQQS